MENIVILVLKCSGNNVKRRTSGYAKDFVRSNKNANCIYCENRLTYQNATTDHIVPISDKGNNCQVNLIVCCKDCNNERGNLPFMEYLRLKNPKFKKAKSVFI
jgi:5-methylcytosine-specific restriction endonuclease McrA